MSDKGEKSIKVIYFTGKQGGWRVWNRKFMARANRCGYKKMLEGTLKIPTQHTINLIEAKDEADYTAADKKNLELFKLNEKAYEDLLLSIDGESKSGKVAFNLVDNAVTPENPDGNCKIAWDRLVNKYAPKTAPSYIHLKKEFANSKLKSAAHNPDDWITDLEFLRTQMNNVKIVGKTDLTEVDLIIHILSNVPEDYEVVVSKIEEQLKDLTTTVKLEDVRTDLSSRYKRIQKNEEETTNEKGLSSRTIEQLAELDETALAAFIKQFKGLCSKCGKYGHKGADCKGSGQKDDSPYDKDRGNRGQCYYCGKFGHQKADCRQRKRDIEQKDKENAAKFAAGEAQDDSESESESEEESMTELGFTAHRATKKFQTFQSEKALKCTIQGTPYPSFTENTWYGDSGASCHITNDDTDMYDVKNINELIGGIGPDAIVATKMGKKKCVIKQANGSTIEKILYPCKYSKDASDNLCSITSEQSKGATLSSDEKNNILLNYPDGSTISFDRRLKTKDGWVGGVDIVPIAESGKAENIKAKSIHVNDLHEQLSHPDEATTRQTGRAMGLNVTGSFKPCEACLVGKAKKTRISKDPNKNDYLPGEHISIDISSPKTRSRTGKKHWLLAVDTCTDASWSWFLKKKDEQYDILLGFIKDLRAKHGKQVKFIRCDNSGENRKLEELCKNEGLGITFEYTAPGTPQQNGKVERKFATLYGRVRAMKIASGLPKNLSDGFWAEAANTATVLDNILLTSNRDSSPFQQFFGKGIKSIVPISTRKFGEMVVVYQNKMKAKMKDRGTTCIWLGYAADHAAGTYRVYNQRTQQVIFTRDVQFLKQTYGEYHKAKAEEAEREKSNTPMTILDDDDSDSDDDIPALNHNVVSDDESSDEEDEENLLEGEPDGNLLGTGYVSQSSEGEESEGESEAPDSNPKLLRELKKLDTSYNPTIKTHETGREESEAARLLVDITKVTNNQQDDSTKQQFEEPRTFQEAWYHPDEYQRKMWREAIRKEYRDMIKHKVWRRTSKRQIPSNRRCIKCKWVFKIKRNGVFRARLVACGYSQIPGVDFSENFSPVVHDITFRALLEIMILCGYYAKIADVETAFLHGKLEEEIYMECPLGMKEVGLGDVNSEEDAVLLLQSIYGTVQSARQYFKKAVRILKEIGFTGGDMDPCLFWRKSSKGTCYIALYVDDNLLVGDLAAIDEVIELLRSKGFILKVEDKLTDYLSCEIVLSKDRKKAWLGQPHLIANLDKKFGDKVKNLRTYKTPGTPNLNMIRDKSQTISREDQKLYRSGVGMLLYLVKHSRPDIANPVRELSKVLDGTTPAAMKEMYRVIKYVLDTRSKGLRIEPTFGDSGPWDLVCFSDSDYAGDPESRRSVSGFILYVKGVPISWRSKAQRSVTLSSSEAEWVALSEAVKEIMFVVQLLESMKIKVKLPVTVRVDNVGAIFMSKNISTSSRTKHVDIRTKYVNEYVEDGIIKIIFVQSSDNDSDIMTKNVSGDLLEKHVEKLIVDKRA